MPVQYHRSRHMQHVAEQFTAYEPLLLICIRVSVNESTSIYDAVRYAWRVDPRRANPISLMLSHCNGEVNGVFRSFGWRPATRENFPEYRLEYPERFGFVGDLADAATTAHYLHKGVPQVYRLKGAANPVRYVPAASTAPPPFA